MGSGVLALQLSVRGLMLTTHLHLVSRLKSEWSYISALSECLHGMDKEDFYQIGL